jgi:hypothetical protein
MNRTATIPLCAISLIAALILLRGHLKPKPPALEPLPTFPTVELLAMGQDFYVWHFKHPSPGGLTTLHFYIAQGTNGISMVIR